MSAFAALWPTLLDIGRHAATGGYRRYAWTDTDLNLREWFADRARQRGTNTEEDRDPRRRLRRVLGDVPELPTAAGHDAGVLAALVPTATLFVRNPTGVSHFPAEDAEQADCERGAQALADVLIDWVTA